MHVQPVPITTQVVNSNPTDSELYSMHHYVIMFVSDLRQIGGFLRGNPVSSTNKTDNHDIAELVFKVVH